MVAGGKKAKKRAILTLTVGGSAVGAVSVGMCCTALPPPTDPPPQPPPTATADATAEVPEAAPKPECFFTEPRARGVSRRPRIVGGNDAEAGAYPYAVSINDGDRHYCGGSVVNDRWVLTAAHCQVRPGDVARVGSTDRLAGIRIKIEESRIHPNFSFDDLHWDLAVAKLSEPTSVPPVPLADSITPTVATAIGWGRLSETGPVTNTLQEVSVPFVELLTCAMAYGDIDATQTCWGGDGEHDSCFGDSGGALLQLAPAGMVQIGIVSFGRGCAREAPGVYTNVTHPDVRAWIDACTRD